MHFQGHFLAWVHAPFMNGVLPNVLKLQFNVDGLPLFKSSATEFWPILCLVQNSDTHPFVVRLYCGKKQEI